MIKIKVFTFKEIILKLVIVAIFIIIIIASISLALLTSKKNTLDVEKTLIDSTLLAYGTRKDIKPDIHFLREELNFLKTSDVDATTKTPKTKYAEEIVSNDFFQTSHELSVEKISDSKYKIGSVYINSYLKQNIDLNELSKPLEMDINKPCKVLIYHTHTSESYTIDDTNYSDYYRTENNLYNVVAVGKSLSKYLSNYGFHVVQDKTQHDYPSYNGAYKSSLETVEKHLKAEQYDLIFDIHRDALSGNSKFRPTAEINGETAAKIMIVVGSNDAGLKHDNWMHNLKFAIALQEKGNEMYPGLFRDMHLSTSRYNQHTSDKTLIIEVGATGNTIDETDVAMKYFANVLNALVNN